MKNSLNRKKMRVSSAAELDLAFPLFSPLSLSRCLFFCFAFFIGTRTCHFLRKSPGEPMEPITSSSSAKERASVAERERENRMILRLSAREDLNQLYCGHHYFYYYDHLHFAAPTHTQTTNKHMNFGQLPASLSLAPSSFLSLTRCLSVLFLAARNVNVRLLLVRVCAACFRGA